MACTWQQSIYKYLLIRFLSQYYVSSQAEGRGFESRLPLKTTLNRSNLAFAKLIEFSLRKSGIVFEK